jgi:hypothetical protein
MREARVPRRRARRDALLLFEEEPVFFAAVLFAAVLEEDAGFVAPDVDLPEADFAEVLFVGDWEPELDWPETGATASKPASTAARQRAGGEKWDGGTTALMYLL